MPANGKTIFKKAVEQLRLGFQVIEDKDDRFSIKYGDGEISIVCSKIDGKYYNRLLIRTFKKSGKLDGARFGVINKGSYKKDKEAMELFVTALYDNVYNGCNIDYLQSFLFDLLGAH